MRPGHATGYGSRLFLLRFRFTGGPVSNKYARFSPQTACEWVRSNCGGDSAEISETEEAIGGRRLQLPDIVKMCAAVTSLQRTFICIDAVDECVPNHRLEVLDALGQILQMSPSTLMFMTGRSHIRGVVERGLGGRMISVSIKSRDDDIVTYLHARLRKDTTPEAMNNFLENDIVKSISEEISETYVLGGGLRHYDESYTDK